MTQTEATTPKIIPRRFSPRFSARTPRYWLGGDRIATYLLDALSITFPRGEQSFVESVRAYKDVVTDEALARDVRAFITQEMHHSRAHEDFNDWLRTLGLPVDEVDADVEREMARFDGKRTKETHLAATAALEHFTALFAYALLSSPDFLEAVHEDVRPLWIWHAIEEIEHKAVAYDVFDHVGGRYRVRAGMMLFMSVLFTYRSGQHLKKLLRTEERPSLVEWLAFAHRFFGPRGYLRALGPRYLDYLKRDFHPWQHDDAALLEAARARLDEELAKRSAYAATASSDAA